jgi:hypothetical protein
MLGFKKIETYFFYKIVNFPAFCPLFNDIPLQTKKLKLKILIEPFLINHIISVFRDNVTFLLNSTFYNTFYLTNFK